MLIRFFQHMQVILSCVINRDLKYYKVMPTFHHWRAGKQRNGLTFQTAADARAFDKGVLRAYNELIDGMFLCPTIYGYFPKAHLAACCLMIKRKNTISLFSLLASFTYAYTILIYVSL